MVNTYYPSSQTTVGYDLHSGNKYISTNESGTEKNQCYVCKGTGREKRPITSLGSSDTKKYCNECGEWMYGFDLHIHQTCSSCKGKGYY